MSLLYIIPLLFLPLFALGLVCVTSLFQGICVLLTTSPYQLLSYSIYSILFFATLRLCVTPLLPLLFLPLPQFNSEPRWVRSRSTVKTLRDFFTLFKFVFFSWFLQPISSYFLFFLFSFFSFFTCYDMIMLLL